MPMYNLIEYSDNYSYTFGSFCQFKKAESPVNNDENTVDVTTNNSISFEHSSIFQKNKLILIMVSLQT